jgi:plasmid replication initiation protein
MKKTGNTLKAKATDYSLVKPGELIDVIELTPLKLHDKRLFNEMLANAWADIGEGKEHKIHKSDIRAIDKNLGRLEDSVDRLVGTIIKTVIEEDGEKYRRTFTFLSRIDNTIRDDGWIKYKFSEDAENMMLNSNVFARIQREVMFALSSRYSLSLYEILAKRVNLKHTQSEMFELPVFRKMLGVPDDKYKLMSHLRTRILDTAFGEVQQLTNIGCAYQLVRNRGKGYTHIKIIWFPKDASAAYDAEKSRKKPKSQQIAERKEQAELMRTGDKASRVYRKTSNLS